MGCFGAVLDVDTLVLVVAVDTEKVEVNTPSPSAVDTGSDPADVIRAGADPIGGKSNANLLLFSFTDIVSSTKLSKFEQLILNLS